MLDLTWRILVALVGLYFIRSALYRKHWGHGRLIWLAVGLGLAFLLIRPLWTGVPAARPWVTVAGALAVTPWRRLMVARLERGARRGVEALAEEWGTDVVVEEETGLWHAERPPNGRREAWVGNALTEVRSLHPGVSTHQTWRMMAFVVRLEAEPGLECALSRGRNQPAYHDREWRFDTTMQGQAFAMSMGDLLTEGFRETGGAVAELAPVTEPGDERFGSFNVAVADDDNAFHRTFSGDLLDAFFDVAFRTLPFELNITPTSVNIYTTYCGEDVQRAHLRFLDRLAEVVMEGN